MDEATLQRLYAINQAFYAAQARAFSATRQRPWPGIGRALEHVDLSTPHVLDIGCGNGRLVTALRERFGETMRYMGLDASTELLALAENQHGAANVRFVPADFVRHAPEHALPNEGYDLVTMIAVMHHVPTEARRRALLAAAAARLTRSGVLAFTLWRFDRDPRFAAHRVQSTDLKLDSGDCLLRWGDTNAQRYCHFTDEAELERLLAGLGLTLIDRYQADGAGGALNDYIVLRR